MKHVIIAIITVLLLTACTAQPTPTLAPTSTLLPPTATPLPPTPTLSPVEPLLEAYEAGQDIDVSSLSPAEFQEFSVKLAEKKNAERGINPVLYKDEAYIHPDTLMMMDYDGHADMEETIIMYLAIAGRDSVGNLQIIDEDGKIITIANSAGIDWNMVVTDPNDPRIDLANTGRAVERFGGLTMPQRMVGSVHKDKSLAPMILLDKNPGVIYFYGDTGPRELPTYQFLKVETDQNGNPILARKFLIFPAEGTFDIFNEGSTNTINGITLNSLSIDSVYYLIIRENQEDLYTKSLFANPNDYTGIIDGNEGPSVLTGDLENHIDMILLGTDVLIKPAN